jgi:AcrR family transcriptional regulator
MSPKRQSSTRQPTDDPLVSQRREQILDAAAPFFGENGYAASDVQLLADQLGVGKGTIYRYFPSKRQLFLAAVDRGMRQMHACVEAARSKAKDPLDQLARAIRAYLAFFDAHPELVELFILERAVFKDRKKPTYFQHRDKNMGPWIERFHGLITAGRVRDMPIERIADVLNGLLYGTMFTNYFVGRRKSFQAEAAEILDVVFNGILTESERKRRNGQRFQ